MAHNTNKQTNKQTIILVFLLFVRRKTKTGSLEGGECWRLSNWPMSSVWTVRPPSLGAISHLPELEPRPPIIAGRRRTVAQTWFSEWSSGSNTNREETENEKLRKNLHSASVILLWKVDTRR